MDGGLECLLVIYLKPSFPAAPVPTENLSSAE